jgi:hypothetical protein
MEKITLSFQARQKTLKSGYNFKRDRAVHGNKVTVLLNEKVASTNNGNTLADPARVGRTVIKILIQIQKWQNSRVKATEEMKLERVQSKLAASKAHSSPPVKPEVDTASPLWLRVCKHWSLDPNQESLLL